ncbi:MAG: ribosome maturation factor RimP [Acidimicrobiia bacterium]|nr:ribosome maturation factor RimP [Acidimicrobiia bacterium]
MSRIEEQIWDILAGYLTAEDIDLDDVEVVGGGKTRLCRVTLDAEGGLDSDRLTRISPAISKMLDESDLFSSPYMLEISSPGLERKLRRPAHYTKSIGREVTVKTSDRQSYKGILESVHEDQFTLSTDDGAVELPYADVTSAKTVFRWEGN